MRAIKSLSYKSVSPDGGRVPCMNCRVSVCNADSCDKLNEWLRKQREVRIEWHVTDNLKTVLSYLYKLTIVSAIIYLIIKVTSLVH